MVKNKYDTLYELVNSYFHLCECGYHHDCVVVDALAVGIADVDNDPVAFYLGYYERSLSRRLYVLDLRIVRMFV
jgi:hypothetical protein